MSAGYSGTPLARKLGYAPGLRAHLDNAPPHYLGLLDGLPGGVVFLEDPCAEAELIHVFVTEAAALPLVLAAHLEHLTPRGALWVSWPKRAAKVPTDVTEDVVRQAALPFGLVDVKVCAVDATWSALKLVRRRGNAERG
ncbi:MAG TPA: hypothetical protein VD962_00655 [Rubricoccaceae bacterium]|nr:hypothetical protein [Rubricoccaceae bacterium]